MEIISDVAKVVVRFLVNDADVQQFCDALYFTQDEYASIGPREIEAIQQKRYTDYLAAIAAIAQQPKPPKPVLTVDEKQALRNVLLFQRAELDDQIATLDRGDTP